MKVIAGRWLCSCGLSLRESGSSQAAVAFEDLAALAPDWLRAEGGEFVIPVRLAKGVERNPEPAQPVHALDKLAFACDGADDQVRMRQVSGKKRFRNLDGCVAGLDDLLRSGEVVPHEQIDVGCVVLREFHG